MHVSDRPARDSNSWPDAPTDVVGDWAASGAFLLTGRATGVPVLPAGNGASRVREQLASIGQRIPGLLGERAAHTGFTRRGPWSCGGAFRVLKAQDGHVGLSLARRSDRELVPALVEDAVDDPWEAAAQWAARSTTAAATARLRLLGLPGGVVPDPGADDRPGVIRTRLGERRRVARPVVVDLTSLWAGPLCAHLLGLAGARVIKVESVHRPDGARLGAPGLFDLLHHGHEQLRLDFRTELDQLRALIGQADLVLESSRSRALRQIGIVAEDVVAEGTSWLSLTAQGRSSDAVGFGDDVAASAGLVVSVEGDVLPSADAVADPLSGVAAAVAACQALAAESTYLVDVSMLHVAAETVVPARPPHEVFRRGAHWWVEHDGGATPIQEPHLRRSP